VSADDTVVEVTPLTLEDKEPCQSLRGSVAVQTPPAGTPYSFFLSPEQFCTAVSLL
jgi:hypothetical protein